MKRMGIFVVVALLVASMASVAGAARVPLIAKQVPVAPVLDGVADDAAWKIGFRYPLVFNQLVEADQVYTRQDDLMASFRLVWTADNKLYGVLYRQDDIDNKVGSAAHETDSIEIFFDFDYKQAAVTQIRALIGENFAQTIGSSQPQAVWSADNKVVEFVIDLAAAGCKPTVGSVIGFNIAINDNDEGRRETQLYPFPGNNTSWRDANSLGDLLFQ